MLTAIVDLQFGSTGKGLLAGYLSTKNDYDVVVSANMPNAGHTFVEPDGTARVHKVLPSGVYSPGLQAIMIGPGAVFDISRLADEIAGIRGVGITAPVLIHPAAGILLERHRDAEQKLLSHISSTMQGSMEALAEKMRRGTPGSSNVAANFMVDIEAAGGRVMSHDAWVGTMVDAANILVEGSQGYSLGIHAGFYPYCTSRDCTVWRLLADAGVIMGAHKLRVVGSARVHPIRVGNTANGWSGPCYPDQHETTWEALGQTPETTTVTKRVRRVFTFSAGQIKEAIFANRVDEVFLNFCNYDPAEAIRVKAIIDSFAGYRHPSFSGNDEMKLVSYMGFGPAAKDVLDVRGYVPF